MLDDDQIEYFRSAFTTAAAKGERIAAPKRGRAMTPPTGRMIADVAARRSPAPRQISPEPAIRTP